MLLKLIPGRQEPTIHFSISFAELPATLPSPASWTVQMSHLIREDLEVPATLHSLDRAAGIPSLLEEVSLDLELREVMCRFIDGSVEQFAFDHNGETLAGRFTDALENIVTVVAESTREDERAALEQKRIREKQRTRSMSVAVVPAAPVKPGSKVVVKHKKQRSLFMQFVSCVGSMISLTSPSTSSLPHRSAKLPTSSTRTVAPNTLAPAEAEAEATGEVCIPPAPGASARARALRRAARSALVDTFRRFVLGELASRYYVGPNFRLTMGIADRQEIDCPYLYRYQRERNGFCVWILHSMRRRAMERMEQILEEAGAPTPIVSFGQRHREVDNMLQTTTMEVPLSFSDEEDEGDDQPLANAEKSPAKSTSVRDAQKGQDSRPSMASRRTSSMTSHSSDSVSVHSSTTCSSGESASSTSTAATSVESDAGFKNLTASRSEESFPTRRESLLSIKEQDHPPLPHLSLAAQHEYMQLYDLRTRLNGLVQFAATQARVAVDESRSRAEMLLVRSKRRAWLNKALKHPVVSSSDKAGAHGSSPYGFAAPFRSSPLAMYVVSADDLARQRSAISRGSVSSTSSLSSAYFRSVSSVSSASSSTSSVSRRSSLRPRIRPKIDFEAALAAAVVELDTNDSDDVCEPIKFADVPCDEDCEFEIFDKPSDARRHRKQRAELPVVPQGTQVFPVTEDQHNLSLRAVRGRNHRRSFEIDQGHRTFMGCDEIRVEDTMHSEIVDKQHFELGFGYPVQMFPLRPHASETQCVEPISPTDVGAEHMASETELGIHKPIGAGRPKIRPRMRTNSMIGALLRGAKGVQKTFGNAPKPPPKTSNHDSVPPFASTLPENSILCQPLATYQQPPMPPPVSPSLAYISYDHNPPSVPPAALPQFAANRRAVDISRPSSPACASAIAVYPDPQASLDVEMNIQVGVSDPNNDDIDAPSKNGDGFSSPIDAPLATPRKRSSSYLDMYRTNHPRPKLDGVFAEPEAVAPR